MSGAVLEPALSRLEPASDSGSFNSSRPGALLEEGFVDSLPAKKDSCFCQLARREKQSPSGGRVDCHRPLLVL